VTELPSPTLDMARAEQALRILDAIGTIPEGSAISIHAPDPISRQWRACAAAEVGGRVTICPGTSALDALAQLSQHIVSSEEPWGEPGELDAESDVDAFDRACGVSL